MGFKNSYLRTIVLIAIGFLMLFGMFIKYISHHGSRREDFFQSAHLLVNKPMVISNGFDQEESVKLKNNIRQMKDIKQEDTPLMKEMREQMDSDRIQQKKIKMLKLQLEQTNLQLEQEKALSEITKLEKENTSVVNSSNDQGQDKYPDVKVLYIGGTSNQKEAILSINGSNYSVKELNKPIKNMEVISITDTAVVVHFNQPQDLKSTFEYKPE